MPSTTTSLLCLGCNIHIVTPIWRDVYSPTKNGSNPSQPHIIIDAPLNSLKDSNASSKMNTSKEKGVGVTLPNLQHFEGKKGVLELWDED
jgi:hypothetical protein